MKKKMIIGIIIFIIVLFSVWLLTRPEVLGNINQVFTEPTTSTSSISFTGETGDKIKFSFRSDIKEGDLEIVLYDSDGNIVDELDKAKALETYFFLDEVQEIKNWEKVVNSLASDFDVDIYVAGSNSRMMSSELSTYLTGRYVTFRIYTLSFSEYLTFKSQYAPVENGRVELANYKCRKCVFCEIYFGLSKSRASFFG